MKENFIMNKYWNILEFNKIIDELKKSVRLDINKDELVSTDDEDTEELIENLLEKQTIQKTEFYCLAPQKILIR